MAANHCSGGAGTILARRGRTCSGGACAGAAASCPALALVAGSIRSATLQPKDLTGKPTWAQLPAVKAGQVLGWPSEPIFSYAKCADQIEALTKAVTGAKKVS